MRRVALISIAAIISLAALNPKSGASAEWDKSAGSVQAQAAQGESPETFREKSDDSTGYKKFLTDTAIHYGFIWGGRLFYVRLKNDRIFDASLSQFFDNFTKLPEFDDGDGFETNFVFHPLFGAEYYLFYRARGHGILASALGSFVQSALFEYTVEGLVERPSAPDLLFTPGIGVPLGIGLENLSAWLIKRENPIARTAAYLVNPTRLFIENGNIGLINPVAGTFAFKGEFATNSAKSKAIALSYPVFFESPLPLGGFAGNFEVVNLGDELGGGEFILYSLRFDFPSEDGLRGVYIEVPYGGVNNVRVGERNLGDGFEFGNIRIGGKAVARESEGFILAGGFEITPPTGFKDNRDRLKTIVRYRRDVPLYLPGALTLTPYVSAAAQSGALDFQASVGVDSILDANKIEGDNFEARLKYAAALGFRPNLPFSPIAFIELDGYTSPTASDIKKTDLFITPGVKFGEKYGAGLAVQIPIAGESADIARASLILDFQARF
ncbi:MAG: DUF3943 domain-containing protein [Deltaproteobacteria bacterium]